MSHGKWVLETQRCRQLHLASHPTPDMGGSKGPCWWQGQHHFSSPPSLSPGGCRRKEAAACAATWPWGRQLHAQKGAEAASTEQPSQRATAAKTLTPSPVCPHAQHLSSTAPSPEETLPNSKPAQEGAKSCTFTEIPLVRNREGEMPVLMEHDLVFHSLHRAFLACHTNGRSPDNPRH